MKRNSIYTLIACLLLAACSSEEEWNLSDHTPAVELGEGQIAVQLNLQTTDFTVEENPLCHSDRFTNRKSDVQSMVIAL